MKTRVIQTRFWDDEFIVEADIYTQHLYIYLLTCQYVNLCGIFQLPVKKIQFEAKLSPEQFEKAAESLKASKKVLIHNGWVFIHNVVKNNNYFKSPLNVKAYNKELDNVPNHIKEYINTCMDTSIYTTYKQEIINKKPEIISIGDKKIKKNPILVIRPDGTQVYQY